MIAWADPKSILLAGNFSELLLKVRCLIYGSFAASKIQASGAIAFMVKTDGRIICNHAGHVVQIISRRTGAVTDGSVLTSAGGTVYGGRLPVGQAIFPTGKMEALKTPARPGWKEKREPRRPYENAFPA